MRAKEPPADFHTLSLDIVDLPPSGEWGRIYSKAFPDPLGFGKKRSRFFDPRNRVEEDRFGVFYLAESLKVCFVEAILRDERDGIIGSLLLDEIDFTERYYVRLSSTTPLKLLDLRGESRIRQGVPSDVVGGRNQSLAHLWSVAFHTHPEMVDGILYPSRLLGLQNVAIYNRGISKLRAGTIYQLDAAPGLGDILKGYRVAVRPPP